MGDFLSCSVVAEFDEVVTGERASCLLQPTTRSKAAESMDSETRPSSVAKPH